MDQVPSTIPAVLKRLRRRLAIGLFLEIWPAWAVTSLIVAGTIVVVCRMFVAGVAPYLAWLWLLPVLTAIPALVLSVRRPAHVVRDIRSGLVGVDAGPAGRGLPSSAAPAASDTDGFGSRPRVSRGGLAASAARPRARRERRAR